MTPKKWFSALLAAAVLVLVGYVVLRHDASTPAVQDGAYQWRFSESGGDEHPKTQVTLVAHGTSYDAGTYDGTCEIQPQDYLPKEKSKVVCWYIGGGHELGVFEEPGQVVLRVGELDEGAGGEEGFRGNFTLLKRL